MSAEELKRKLLEDISLDIKENDRDLKRAAARYDELMVERRKLLKGYYEIKGSGIND
jgi:hypothetical protein